jgi:hypothetical protein
LLVTETWNRQCENALGSSFFTPLHQNPLELAGKVVLTRAGLSPVVKREKNGV